MGHLLFWIHWLMPLILQHSIKTTCKVMEMVFSTGLKSLINQTNVPRHLYIDRCGFFSLFCICQWFYSPVLYLNVFIEANWYAELDAHSSLCTHILGWSQSDSERIGASCNFNTLARYFHVFGLFKSQKCPHRGSSQGSELIFHIAAIRSNPVHHQHEDLAFWSLER